MKAADIPDAEVLEAIDRVGAPNPSRWAFTWDIHDALSKYPPKVVQAKLASLVRRGLVDGHPCSSRPPYCRGDFTVTEKGRSVSPGSEHTCQVCGGTRSRGIGAAPVCWACPPWRRDQG